MSPEDGHSDQEKQTKRMVGKSRSVSYRRKIIDPKLGWFLGTFFAKHLWEGPGRIYGWRNKQVTKSNSMDLCFKGSFTSQKQVI